MGVKAYSSVLYTLRLDLHLSIMYTCGSAGTFTDPGGMMVINYGEGGRVATKLKNRWA